jgi:hypothetical protein
VQQLREQLPDTELRMIVGMAQGADLLVVQTALALGVGVEAVLPMPLDQYAADFDAETLVSLKKLLRHPEIRCVELSSGAPTDDACLQHSPAQRDAMYANLTDTLIRRSSLLLALWDGRPTPAPGSSTGHRPRAMASPLRRTPDRPAFCSVSAKMSCRCSRRCRRG